MLPMMRSYGQRSYDQNLPDRCHPVQSWGMSVPIPLSQWQCSNPGELQAMPLVGSQQPTLTPIVLPLQLLPWIANATVASIVIDATHGMHHVTQTPLPLASPIRTVCMISLARPFCTLVGTTVTHHRCPAPHQHNLHSSPLNAPHLITLLPSSHPLPSRGP